jgi:ankyrin repeat protein
VKPLLASGVNSRSAGLSVACANGHINTVLFLISLDNNRLHYAIQIACRYGHRDLARVLEGKGGKCDCNLTHH